MMIVSSRMSSSQKVPINAPFCASTCAQGVHDLRQNRHAGFGRNDIPRRSEKQRQPRFLLDLTDLLRERGLGHNTCAAERIGPASATVTIAWM